MKRIFLLSGISLALVSCHSDSSINRFSDAIRLKIADLQDRRLPDSLYPYFSHKNAVYRKDAVQSFASIQDPDAADKIGKLLLMDADTAVRKAAAFALGQIQNSECERILLGALVKEKISGVVFEILQSYGKTTKRWQLDRPALLNDSTKTAGVAWSLYRAGLRGKTDSLANRVARRLLDQKYSSQIRLGAAHYFARGSRDFEDAEKELIEAATHDPAAEVRMVAALSLGKLISDSSLVALKNILRNEKDPRVLVNALRALKAFPYSQMKHYLYEALSHKDVHVGIAGSEVIIETIVPQDWIEVSAMTNQISNWRIQANVYEAALKAGNNKDLAEDIKVECEKAYDPYQKAAIISSLKHYPQAYAYVENQLRKADTPVLRSAAAGTLVSMNRSKSFLPALQPHFANLFRDLMQSDDPAVLGSIAGAIGDSTLGYEKRLKDPSFLYEAKKRLNLPKDNEALQAIEAAIAHLENRKNAALVKNEFNHPIQWDLVKTIPSDQIATIQTTKGSIIIRLLVNESPGSVANFVALVKKNYFDNKFSPCGSQLCYSGGMHAWRWMG